jgi:gamma-glutamyltranspeptidase/glutathione hydrolase
MANRTFRTGARILPSLLAASLVLAPAAAQPAPAHGPVQPIIRYDSAYHPTVGTRGMVVSQKALASEVGAAMLRKGGNAVDAAVAVGFALAVVLPRAGNLGGGGFMLVHSANTGDTIALDFRERAPAAATAPMFLDEAGNIDQALYRFSHLAAGVPGSVAGLLHALEGYGSLPRATVMAPAIALAREGFRLDHDIASAMQARRQQLSATKASRALFLDSKGQPHPAGTLWRQPQLARTLERIAAQGRAGFYEGRVAQQIATDMAANGGLISLADLAGYQVRERPVTRGHFHGYEVQAMPPPSSGGVHLVQMLNVLSHFPLADLGPRSAQYYHTIAEAMKLAYADRSKHLGDPDFYNVPGQWLTSPEYGTQLAARIRPSQATPAAEIAPGTPAAYESEDTTHYSVMDAKGNAVATTYTLNFSFGSGIVVPGAGFLLNNEMADFSAKPGEPDPFGLLGGEANAIEPGKRPLSAMTPTILLKDGRPVLVTGSPGGSRIITTVLQHVLNMTAHGMNAAQANHAPRIHHQWQPDVLYHEPGLSPETLGLLRAKGHRLEQRTTMGSVQAIAWDGAQFYGTADPRRPGALAVPVMHSEATP